MRTRRAAPLLGVVMLAAGLAGASPTGGATAAPAAVLRPGGDVEVDSRIVTADGTLQLVGSVRGGGGSVVVEKATTCRPLAFGTFQCDWKTFEKVRLDRSRRYRVAIEVPREEGRDHGLYWRATVGEQASPIWRSFRAAG